ncbi:MAG: hypothetical protein ABIT01_20425, partial [Thermoanaerobaculia bacterium]
VGTVMVSGQQARWELEQGTFPHATASVALAARGAVTLLDTKEKISAACTVSEFESLFRGLPSGDSGASHPSVRDLSVAVKPDGAGRSFQGTATRRYAIEVRWVLAVNNPGRFVSVKNVLLGTIEAAPDFEDARSPFDELTRLFPLRGETLEALTPELRQVAGLPVFVNLEMSSELQSENVGPDVGEGMRKTPRTTTTVTRRVLHLQRRKRAAGDSARLAAPEEYKLRGLERLQRSAPGLP